MKLFLKRPQAAQGLVQKVLNAATAESDNPDIRDRAYVYWRLLSNTTDQNAAKNVILSEKPPITTTIQSLPPALLERLLGELTTLASVYHKPPSNLLAKVALAPTLYNKLPLRRQCKMLGRTPSQQWCKARPQSLKTMLRTCLISTSTVLHRHLRRKSRPMVFLVSRALLVLLNGSHHLLLLSLHLRTTWMIFLEYLAMRVHQLAHPALRHLEECLTVIL